MRTVTEWSLEFDLLWNNIFSDKAPGLNEYEKSVFLTNAQEAVIVALYRGTLLEPFESTEEVTAYLGMLVKQADCTLADESEYKISENSVLYENPEDMLFRTWEGCTVENDCGDDVQVPVVPITQDEYWKIIGNPFRGANGRRVLRLSYQKDSTGDDPAEYGVQTYSELISKNTISLYTVRYIKRPDPIILAELSGGLEIHGQTEPSTCKLDEGLHQTILAEAVRMAKAVWNT